MPTSLIRGWVY